MSPGRACGCQAFQMPQGPIRSEPGHPAPSMLCGVSSVCSEHSKDPSSTMRMLACQTPVRGLDHTGDPGERAKVE